MLKGKILYDDGISLRRVPRSEDPQYDVEKKITGFFCLCGCYKEDHALRQCFACDSGCEEYRPDESKPIFEEPYEPDPDTCPGGHDDYQ